MLTPIAAAGRAAARPNENEFVAFCIVERADAPPTWVRCGVARLARDGAINVHLDALPLSGELHLRPVDRDAQRALVGASPALARLADEREDPVHPLHS